MINSNQSNDYEKRFLRGHFRSDPFLPVHYQLQPYIHFEGKSADFWLENYYERYHNRLLSECDSVGEKSLVLLGNLQSEWGESLDERESKFHLYRESLKKLARQSFLFYREEQKCFSDLGLKPGELLASVQFQRIGAELDLLAKNTLASSASMDVLWLKIPLDASAADFDVQHFFSQRIPDVLIFQFSKLALAEHKDHCLEWTELLQSYMAQRRIYPFIPLSLLWSYYTETERLFFTAYQLHFLSLWSGKAWLDFSVFTEAIRRNNFKFDQYKHWSDLAGIGQQKKELITKGMRDLGAGLQKAYEEFWDSHL